MVTSELPGRPAHGCNLRILVVGIKALHRIKRSQCIIGGSPPWASREENLPKIGVLYVYMGEVERFPDVSDLLIA